MIRVLILAAGILTAATGCSNTGRAPIEQTSTTVEASCLDGTPFNSMANPRGPHRTNGAVLGLWKAFGGSILPCTEILIVNNTAYPLLVQGEMTGNGVVLPVGGRFKRIFEGPAWEYSEVTYQVSAISATGTLTGEVATETFRLGGRGRVYNEVWEVDHLHAPWERKCDRRRARCN